MSRLSTALLAALAGPTPEEELAIRTSGGQAFTLQPNAELSALSPAAKEALFGGERADDLPVVLGPQGERLDGGSGFTDQRTNQSSTLSEEELIALGAAERDPSTGRLVRAGTGNPMTAASGFDQRLAQPILRERFQERQKVIRAERDADTILELVETDGAPIDVIARAVDDLRKTSGLSQAQLLEIPAYRKLTNAEGEYVQQIQAARAQKAQRLGYPVDAIKDDGSNEVDPEWLQAQQVRQQEALLRQKPAITLAQAELSRAEKQLSLELDRVNTVVRQMEKSGDVKSALIYSQRETAAAWDRFNRRHEEVTGKKAAAQEVVSQARTGSAPPPAPTQITHPKLPEGATITGEFQTGAEARGRIPPNSYAVIAGILFRTTAWGELKEVK